MTTPDAAPDAPRPDHAPPAPAAAPAGYAGTAYQPVPQGAYHPYYGPDPRTKNNWMNIVALAASLSGLVMGWTVIAGIVFGHLGLAAVKRGEADNRTMGLAGLIVGYSLLGLMVLGVVIYLAFIGVVLVAVGASEPDAWSAS